MEENLVNQQLMAAVGGMGYLTLAPTYACYGVLRTYLGGVGRASCVVCRGHSI